MFKRNILYYFSRKIGIIFIKIFLISIIIGILFYNKNDFIFTIGFYLSFISISISFICAIVVIFSELIDFLNKGKN